MNILKHDNVHTDRPGKRRIRKLEDEYAKLWQMYGDLDDERDLLREALQAISINELDAARAQDIARTALQEVEV